MSEQVRYKLRLLLRKGIADQNGTLAGYIYKTDDIYLPDNANAFQFPDVEQHGWLPEIIGGEWIKETKHE